jgi:dTDP-3-amino-3,4,6-trideoxy-alpha-D-glucose transaminase
LSIPFLDLKAAYLELKADLDAAYRRVMDGGWYVLGREVEALEAEFAVYCGVRHCVTVGNGLDALALVLRAAGVGAGDEVIVPGHTFIATWLAVSAVGAVPVAVDVDEGTGLMDPRVVEQAVTPRTAAVLPVHLYGQPADMGALGAVARRHGLLLVEDAAQAHGARSHGRRAGGLGHAAGFSFYPVKNLGAFGDGGAVTTDDGELAGRVRLLRNYGSRAKYQHDEAGVNSRLDELQAAFLRAKLGRLDTWNGRRARLADIYDQGLAGLPGLALPAVAPGAEPVWHLYVVRHARRDELRQHLERAGIGSLIHYPTPPHLAGAYAQRQWRGGPLPVAERLSRSVLSLPIGPHLSAADARRVAETVTGFVSAAGRAAA